MGETTLETRVALLEERNRRLEKELAALRVMVKDGNGESHHSMLRELWAFRDKLRAVGKTAALTFIGLACASLWKTYVGS